MGPVYRQEHMIDRGAAHSGELSVDPPNTTEAYVRGFELSMFDMFYG